MEDEIAREAIMHLIASMTADESMSPRKMKQITNILNKDSDHLGLIEGKFSQVTEINEVVGVVEVIITDCPVKLKIKVLKVSHLPQAPYMGIANYGIKNPTQSDSYSSIHNCKTAQEAFEDALTGFLVYFKPELVKDTEFDLDEDW